eukprot:GHVS01106904.1.p1 GENE.GHVS01106904.1~~GHVS01106904.1.p1  ORF type:complete len:116 (-),score=4.99 GHVS01106904.1:140-487(-)
MIPSIAHLILLLLGTIPFVTTDLPLFARACRKALSLWNHLEDSEEEYELWVNKAFGDSCDATNGHFNNGGSRLWLYLEDDSLRMTFQSEERIRDVPVGSVIGSGTKDGVTFYLGD